MNAPYAKRRPTRLSKFDYATPRTYFVTVVVQDRRCVLGDVLGSDLQLSHAGEMVAQQWRRLPARWPQLEVAPFITIPNHLHGILGTYNLTSPPPLGTIVGAFKSITARAYRRGAARGLWPNLTAGLWQRGFHDHIIRDVDDEERIAEYIANNPITWHEDPENPLAPPATTGGDKPRPYGASRIHHRPRSYPP